MMDDDDDDDNNDDHKMMMIGKMMMNADEVSQTFNVCETSSAFISYPCYSYRGSTVMHLLIESTGAHLG